MNLVLAFAFGIMDDLFGIFLNRNDLDHGLLYFSKIIAALFIVAWLAVREEVLKKSFFSAILVMVLATTGGFLIGVYFDWHRARELHYYFNYEVNIYGWFIGFFLTFAAYGLLKLTKKIYARIRIRSA